MARSRSLGRHWTLLFGIGGMVLGNSLHGTLLSVRAGLEHFPAMLTGLVMASYFVGSLAGSILVPNVVARVGHVRTFGGLSALASATVLLYPIFVDPLFWIPARIAIGFCFSGAFVICESWLNASADNDNRGGLLSVYMIVISAAMCAGQLLLNLGDPGSFTLFTLISVLVSVSVMPILMVSTPAPAFGRTERVSVRTLYAVSPLGVVGMIVASMGQSTLTTLGGLYGVSKGFSVLDISLLMGAFYGGVLLLQWPIGKLSDRFDRRRVIGAVSALAAVCALALLFVSAPGWGFFGIFGILGGLSLPVYALCLSHTNDYLTEAQMVAASGALVMLNGVGSLMGPLIVAPLMQEAGTSAFLWGAASFFCAVTGFAIWRIRRYPSRKGARPGDYMPMTPMQNLTPAPFTALGPEAVSTTPVEKMFEEFTQGSSEPDPPSETSSS